jgi:hypothetical protein
MMKFGTIVSNTADRTLGVVIHPCPLAIPSCFGPGQALVAWPHQVLPGGNPQCNVVALEEIEEVPSGTKVRHQDGRTGELLSCLRGESATNAELTMFCVQVTWDEPDKTSQILSLPELAQLELVG